MDRFPIELFPPSEHKPYLAGSALVGGQPISGPPQTADMSAGGWWTYDLQIGILRTRAQFSSWRAFLATLNSGVTACEVPILDILQPWPGGLGNVPEGVPHSDFAPFADTGLYATEPIVATLFADAYMPAWPSPPVAPTVAQIQITAGGGLRGGEYFSITGPSGQVRLHMVARITGALLGNVTQVSVVPPFREDMEAGTLVDFNEPRCTMKADIGSISDAWPSMTAPFTARPKIRFIETGF